LPARLGEPQRGLALAGEALVGALRLESHFLKSARIEPKLFLLFACIFMNINVETGWKIWACEPGKFGFCYTHPLLHTRLNSILAFYNKQ
jgi:hypothetical protein